MASRFVVALYDIALAYGGPEEGGWWYTRGSLVGVVKSFHSEEKAGDYCYRLNQKLNSHKFGPNKGKREMSSVASDGVYSAQVHENIPPAGFPDRRPHYE